MQETLGNAWKRVAICGDDLLAVWPTTLVETYNAIIGECGGKISEGKHFTFSNAGCFTEKLFFLRTRQEELPFAKPETPICKSRFSLEDFDIPLSELDTKMTRREKRLSSIPGKSGYPSRNASKDLIVVPSNQQKTIF